MCHAAGLPRRRWSCDSRSDGVVLGALAIGISDNSSSLEIGIADLQDSYYINYPASGSMRARHRGRTVEVMPGLGAVYHPHPMIAAPLHDALVTGFVHATSHRWQDVLARPARSWSQTPVRRAVDAICADPTQPFTPTSLARLAGTSPRTLHDDFRRHLDTTPMAYLRAVRLEGAHAELRVSEPGDTTVAKIAYRWGFGHVSRFSLAYRRVYGRSPAASAGAEPAHPSVNGRALPSLDPCPVRPVTSSRSRAPGAAPALPPLRRPETRVPKWSRAAAV